MGKKSLFALFFSFIIISACQSQQARLEPTPSLSPSLPSISATQSPSNQPTLLPNLTQMIAAGCTSISPKPTPGPTEESLFPSPRAEDWQRGSPSAAVTITEYCDFQAQPCAQLAVVLAQLLLDYPQQLRVVYRHYPLTTVNDKALLAVQAAEAAGRQGDFWKMHDLLYEKQTEWSNFSPSQFQDWLSSKISEIGLNKSEFLQDFQSPLLQKKAQAAWEQNASIGMPGVPFLLLNGKIWSADLPLTYYTLSDYIRLELLEKRQFESCPPAVIDLSKSYQATLRTQKGDILIQLFAQETPITVNNFVFLARQGWYDGITFHRVLKDYIAQSGDPSGTGYGGPGYTFINEVNSKHTFDQAGMVAMANAGKDTNGSQFFITLNPAPQLNEDYTIFGEVLQGMEVLQKLALRNPTDYPPPPPGDLILSVTIQEH
ncbi:MAG: peptidylprolyl isomerase [Anaerolineales bacterium]